MSDSVKGLRNLFVDELKEIYWSEAAIKRPLHKMIKHTSSDELMNELTKHLEAIKQHQLRLEEVFLIIDEKIEVVKSKAVDAAALLHKTLEEEKQANEMLSQIIETMKVEMV